MNIKKVPLFSSLTIWSIGWIMVNLAACQKSCNPPSKGELNRTTQEDQNTTKNIKKNSIAMVPSSTTVSDMKKEVTFKQSASATDPQNVAIGGHFKLAIKVIAIGGGGKFMYKINGVDQTVDAGSSRAEELDSILGIKKETILQAGDRHQVTFTFMPEATTKAMTAILLLTDKAGEGLGNVVKLDWEAAANKRIKIELPDPNNALFQGNDPLSIKLLNEGEAISTDKLFIVLRSIPPSGYVSPEFTLGAVKEATKTTNQLAQILGEQGSTLNNKDSLSFELRSNNQDAFYNPDAAVDLQLQVWSGKEQLDSKSIKWRNKKTQVQFVEPASDNAVIKGTDAMKFSLKNTGEADISLKNLGVNIKSDSQTWKVSQGIQKFTL